MGEQVTFWAEVANALLDAGVPVLDRETYHYKVSGLRGDYAPYHLLDGTTLTSEQVRAAVGADPGRLAAREKGVGFLYARLGGKWGLWDGTQYVCTGMSPSDRPNRIWHLVYRPDLDLDPEEPPRPAQGTTLRAIMEWCARTGKYVTACRKSASRTVRIDFAGDMSVDGLLCAEDVYEADDWQAMLDGTTTWFVPGRVAALPRTTRVTSEAVAHGEAGGVVQQGHDLFRVRDGSWEYRSARHGSWTRGQYVIYLNHECTLRPADYLDDASKVEPREGPELWAWIVHRPERIVVSPVGVEWRLAGNQLQMRYDRCEWTPADLFPDVPCVPATGTWDDEADHA